MFAITRRSRWALAAAPIVAALLVAPHALGQEAEEPAEEDAVGKGLFYSPVPKPRPAVKFNLIEIEGKNWDKRKKRKLGHSFKPGERLVFEFEVNREGFVYILNRTLLGNPDSMGRYAGRSISFLRSDDFGRVVNSGPRLSRYTLLYPTLGAGTENYVHKGQQRVVPQRGHFVMDNDPGIEKLFFVWSPVPIDMAQYFDAGTGQLVASNFAGKGLDGQDAELDALDKLNADMDAWGGNSETTSKGMAIDGYGIGMNDAGPMMLEIDVKHKSR